MNDKKIVEIVKEAKQPLSGEISELLDISERATARSFLLTLVGILKPPKVRVYLSGSWSRIGLLFVLLGKKWYDIMTVLVTSDSHIGMLLLLYLCMMQTLFMSCSEKKPLAESCHVDFAKDFSRNSNIRESTPVAVCMTRMPHIKTCHQNMNIFGSRYTPSIVPLIPYRLSTKRMNVRF